MATVVRSDDPFDGAQGERLRGGSGEVREQFPNSFHPHPCGVPSVLLSSALPILA